MDIILTKQDIEEAIDYRDECRRMGDKNFRWTRSCPLARCFNRTFGGKWSVGLNFAYDIESVPVIDKAESRTSRVYYGHPKRVIVFPQKLSHLIPQIDSGLIQKKVIMHLPGGLKGGLNGKSF